MSLEFRPKPLLPGPDTVGSRAGLCRQGRPLVDRCLASARRKAPSAAEGGLARTSLTDQCRLEAGGPGRAVTCRRRGRSPALLRCIPHRPMPARSRRSGGRQRPRSRRSPALLRCIPHRPMPARSRRSGARRQRPARAGGALRSCVAPLTDQCRLEAGGPGRAVTFRQSRAEPCAPALHPSPTNAGSKPAVRGAPSRSSRAGRSPALLRCTIVAKLAVRNLRPRRCDPDRRAPAGMKTDCCRRSAGRVAGGR